MISSQMGSLMESASVLVVMLYPALCVLYRFNPVKDMNKMKSFYRSLPILFLLLAVKMSYDYQSMETNLYSVLQIGRHSSPFEIRQAFKAQSLFHHPDKSPMGRERKEFYAIKAAYDVLMDETKRDAYNRFGSESLVFDPRLDEMTLLLDIFTVYLFWAVMVYVLTVPKSSRGCRTWIALMGVVMVGLQAMFTLMDSTLPQALETTALSSMTEYEAIFVMHSMFPVLAIGLMFLAEGCYFDLNAHTLTFFEQSISTNKELHGLLEHMRVLASRSSAGQVAAEEDTRRLENDLQKAIARLAVADKKAAEALESFKLAGTGSGVNYYGVIFIVVFFVAQLL